MPTNTSASPRANVDEWQAAAQQTLTALWGEQVTCTVTDTLRAKGRNRVYRLGLRGAPVSSVILKAAVGSEDHPYALGDNRAQSAFQRFCNEWAGAQMLGPLGLGPKAYAANPEHGFCLIEDLGNGESLADRLTGNDFEGASSALFAYARSLGEMHAATQGHSQRWRELRHTLGAVTSAHTGAESWQGEALAFRAICQRHGVALPEGFEVEIEQIGHVLANPGEYLVFSPTDCCPDNHLLRGERVQFFDCEWATMRHALLDAAYLLTPFPTCWCTSRLPNGLPERLIDAYRGRFSGGADFDQQLTLVLASWTLAALTWEWAGNWEQEDRHTWGLASLRQRHLHRLENLLARPNLEAVLPNVASATTRLFGILKSSWADLEPMPLYAAFRNAS